MTPPRISSSVCHFYPRPPRGGRPLKVLQVFAGRTYFYPRPPRGGRHVHKGHPRRSLSISIHALREEGDTPTSASSAESNHFYPRPPRGGRLSLLQAFRTSESFLSTPSARRATTGAAISCHSGQFLSTPSARRATPRRLRRCLLPCHFYPRPPRGGRLFRSGSCRRLCPFLSTPSARRATWQGRIEDKDAKISIHALREEGDASHRGRRPRWTHFYPRPPRGGRHQTVRSAALVGGISIHALREEGDISFIEYKTVDDVFLSTPSARRATSATATRCRAGAISIHALREEGDSKNRDKISIFKQIIQHSARI